jgi:hypothetical protein
VTARPFAGRADEPDWVAMREVVPAATAPVKLLDPAYADRAVFLATVLPAGWPGLVRSDGQIFLGLQTSRRSGDLARDLAQALERALETEPGDAVRDLGAPAADAPRIQDVIDPAPAAVTVLNSFDFWVEGMVDPSGQLMSALESANKAVVPTERLTSVDAAYWCRIHDRCHLRWAMPYDEERLLDALARLSAARELSLGEGTKYVGAFRAEGILIPVWDLPSDLPADDVEAPASALGVKISEAIEAPRKLSQDENRARAGLLSRQLTLR